MGVDCCHTLKVAAPDAETYYEEGAPERVKEILERYRRESVRLGRHPSQRLRLFYGDPETGRDWMEEYDVTGYVSRSCGPVKCPILLHNSRSRGGGAISTRHILRIVESQSGREIYRHPNYQEPNLEIGQDKDGRFVVCRDGLVYARFTSLKAAQKWVSKMTKGY